MASHSPSYLAVVASDMVSKFPHIYSSHALGCMLPRFFLPFDGSGEFTSTPHQFGLISEWIVHRTPLYFFYFASQQDRPFWSRHISVCGPSQSPICLVTAVLAFLARRSPVPGPLFVHQGGFPLTRTQLVTAIRSALQMAGCDCSGFSGHIFCIGAATTAAAAYLPNSLIQTLGSWKSSSFLTYIRTPICIPIGILIYKFTINLCDWCIISCL